MSRAVMASNSVELDMFKILQVTSKEAAGLALDYVQAARMAGYCRTVREDGFAWTVAIAYPWAGDNARERADWLIQKGVPAGCLKVGKR